MAEDFFGNLSKTLKKTVDTVGKKTDEFVEIQKIRTRQHALEDQIEKNYQDIGQIIYNRYLNGEAFDENLAGICKDITDLEKEIADCREDVANKRGRIVCPACGASVPKDAAFCMRCGAAMPEKEEEPEDAEFVHVEQEEKAEETEAAAPEEEPEEERPMTLLEHLGELRKRLVRGFLAILIGFFACYGFAQQLFYYLSLPLLKVMPADSKFIYTGVAEGFFVDMKVAFVAGVFVACPFLFYQIWAFIAPGLYEEEKKYIIPLALSSALFFILGGVFCYFGVFPFAFEFFMSYSTDNIVAMLSIDEYLSFALKMVLAFGLIFEMPLFSFFLARMGLITAQKMREVRKYAILAIFVVAAILTPPDVFSQLMMAGPMIVLYEVSIWVAVLVGKKKAEREKAAEEGGA